MAFSTNTGAAPHNPNQDVMLLNPPTDTVQALVFSPSSLAPKSFLVSASWDSEVRCWDVQPNGGSSPVGMIKHDGPVLDAAWSQDGQHVFSAGTDKIVKMWQLSTNNTITVAAHDAPIRHVFYSRDMGNGSPCLITGSWDKSVRYWDVRAPTGNPMGSVPLGEKVYCMDVRSPLLVVGTSDRKLRVYDIRKPTAVYYEKQAQLKYQLRCLATFPDQSGYAVGSVEGRVSIDHVHEKDRKNNDFAFKCHRDNESGIIYPVNSIAFHEQHGTFATAGGDGGFNFWDKDNKQRLKQFQRLNQPITATAFSADGNIFAYAVGYDWSKGAAHHNPSSQKYILLHGVQEAEEMKDPLIEVESSNIVHPSREHAMPQVRMQRTAGLVLATSAAALFLGTLFYVVNTSDTEQDSRLLKLLCVLTITASLSAAALLTPPFVSRGEERYELWEYERLTRRPNMDLVRHRGTYIAGGITKD